MKEGQASKNGWNFLPGGIQPFPFISACGVSERQWRSCANRPSRQARPGCGSRQKERNPRQSQHKKQTETSSAISTRICKMQTAQKQVRIVLSHYKSQTSDYRKKQRNRTTIRFLCLCEADTKKIFSPNLCAYPNSHAFSIACSTSSPPAKITFIFSLDSTTTHSSTCRTSRSSYSMG